MERPAFPAAPARRQAALLSLERSDARMEQKNIGDKKTTHTQPLTPTTRTRKSRRSGAGANARNDKPPGTETRQAHGKVLRGLASQPRCMGQSGRKPVTILANSVKQSESNQRNPICCQSAHSDCMLCVCFLSIVLEKPVKARKRTKAHRLKEEMQRNTLNGSDKCVILPRKKGGGR
jgi:hypothetical protein